MGNKLPKVITRSNIKKYIESIRTKCPTGIRNKSMVMFMYRAGLRVSEVANLTVDDVKFDVGFVYIQQGKGGKDRYVPIDSETVYWAKRWMDERERLGIDSNAFFCTLKGGSVDVRYIREFCYRMSERSGVYVQNGKDKKPISPHVLRHCYGTELLEDGFTIREVQDLLGHTSVNTTMIYTHIRPEALAAKVKMRGG